MVAGRFVRGLAHGRGSWPSLLFPKDGNHDPGVDDAAHTEAEDAVQEVEHGQRGADDQTRSGVQWVERHGDRSHQEGHAPGEWFEGLR